MLKNPGIIPIPDDNNVWPLLTSSVCFCARESDGRHVGVLLCVWRSVMLSVVLATLQSTENELQLQALPPNGGSVHMCICAVCVCVLQMSDGYSQLRSREESSSLSLH